MKSANRSSGESSNSCTGRFIGRFFDCRQLPADKKYKHKKMRTLVICALLPPKNSEKTRGRIIDQGLLRTW
jgi:hypothetical protein